MRDAENIRQVEKLGIDWMGFICWPERISRYVDTTPCYLPSIPRVGVFVNPTLRFVNEKVSQLGLSIVQLHGTESPDFCQQVAAEMPVRVMKAISISDEADLTKAQDYQEAAHYLLFDTKSPKVGGSGHRFRWEILDQYQGQLPFLLAGGIGPDDAEAVKHFSHPRMMGIDLNSKFETEPAMKDASKLKEFINKIR